MVYKNGSLTRGMRVQCRIAKPLNVNRDGGRTILYHDGKLYGADEYMTD